MTSFGRRADRVRRHGDADLLIFGGPARRNALNYRSVNAAPSRPVHPCQKLFLPSNHRGADADCRNHSLVRGIFRARASTKVPLWPRGAILSFLVYRSRFDSLDDLDWQCPCGPTQLSVAIRNCSGPRIGLSFVPSGMLSGSSTAIASGLQVDRQLTLTGIRIRLGRDCLSDRFCAHSARAPGLTPALHAVSMLLIQSGLNRLARNRDP